MTCEAVRGKVDPRRPSDRLVTLLAEVFGVLVAGTAIASLVRLAGSRVFGRTVGVVMVVAAVASFLFLEGVWRLSSSFPASTSVNELIGKQAAGVAAGLGANTGFLAWARAKIVSGNTAPGFWLTPGAARGDAFIYQWSTYQLLPARETDLIREANWIIFYDVDPGGADYDRAVFGRLIVYAPGFAVAQRTSVG